MKGEDESQNNQIFKLSKIMTEVKILNYFKKTSLFTMYFFENFGSYFFSWI